MCKFNEYCETIAQSWVDKCKNMRENFIFNKNVYFRGFEIVKMFVAYFKICIA